MDMSDLEYAASDVAQRFHRHSEWFIHTVDARALHTFRIRANSERVVELFHKLAAHLDSIVDVYVHHVRNGDRWEGALKFLPEIREGIGRLRWPLAAYGGVEFTVVTPTDQVTLMTTLELVIYSQTASWRERLLAEGLQRCDAFPASVWTAGVQPGTVAPELASALTTIAERLELPRTVAESIV